MARTLKRALLAHGALHAEALRRLGWRSLVSPSFALPLLAAFAGEAMFRVVDWQWLQTPMRDLVVGSLSLLGEPALSLGRLRYSVAGETFLMTPRCTYADLLCFTTPLLLRSWSLPAGLKRILLWWGSVLLFCAARITLANFWSAQGAAWFLVHDWIDWGVRSLVMFAVIHLWLVRQGARAHLSRPAEVT